MNPISRTPEVEVVFASHQPEHSLHPRDPEDQNRALVNLRLLWYRRRILFRSAAWGLLAATLLAFLIPKQYQSTTRLMPPDSQSSSSMALFASLSGKLSGSLGGVAGDLLGMQSSGELFIGILGSRTVRDRLGQELDLKTVYGTKSQETAVRILTANTSIAEDRKSGIITITVTDRNPHRAAALAQQYVAQLNTVVSQLSSSSAGRERVFLEGRLKQVKQELESAEQDFSQFASKTGRLTSRNRAEPC